MGINKLSNTSLRSLLSEVRDILNADAPSLAQRSAVLDCFLLENCPTNDIISMLSHLEIVLTSEVRNRFLAGKIK